MRWARKSVRRKSFGASRLRFERLEDRSLLAVAAFYIHLFDDDGGAPGLPLANDTVEAGQTFFAQIVARENHPGFSGLASVFIDIAWDADVLDIVEPFDPARAVTPNLPLHVQGHLQQEGSTGPAFLLEDGIRQNVGHIAGLGGMTAVASGVGKPIGSDGDDRFVKPAFHGLATTDDHFAWLHFRAEQAGQALLTMKQNALRIAPLPVASLTSEHLYFERQIVTVVEPASLGQSPLLEGTPAIVQADDGRGVLNESNPAAEIQIPSVPDSPIQNAPEVPTRVEFVFEHAPEAPIKTPVPTSEIVDTSPIEEPDSASDQPPSSPAVWHNADYPLDVDGTGRVGPLDVLMIANYLNANVGNWELPPVQFSPPRYFDVNGDGRGTPHDALLVINYIERQRTQGAEGEAEPIPTSELSETFPVSERPDHVDAALRDAVFSSGIVRSASREHRSHRADLPVSERPDHVDAAHRDAGRIADSGRNTESQTRVALTSSRSAAETALQERRVSFASWSEIEEILPILTEDWLRSA